MAVGAPASTEVPVLIIACQPLPQEIRWPFMVMLEERESQGNVPRNTPDLIPTRATGSQGQTCGVELPHCPFAMTTKNFALMSHPRLFLPWLLPVAPYAAAFWD